MTTNRVYRSICWVCIWYIRGVGNYESWRDGFLRPTLTTAFEYLRSDRYICWNIADIKVGSDKWFTLEQDSIDILTNDLPDRYSEQSC